MITVLHRGSPKNDYSIAYILGRGIYQEYDLRVDSIVSVDEFLCENSS